MLACVRCPPVELNLHFPSRCATILTYGAGELSLRPSTCCVDGKYVTSGERGNERHESDPLLHHRCCAAVIQQ